jgi:hypothetical protein
MERRRDNRPVGGVIMTRTWGLLVMHDSSDPKARDALGKLLLAGGKNVELEWLSERLAVVLIAPHDLENSTKDEDER